MVCLCYECCEVFNVQIILSLAAAYDDFILLTNFLHVLGNKFLIQLSKKVILVGLW